MNELEESMDWFWGVLQGDFNDDQTTGQIIVGTVISMIPVIDQIADIRDIVANLFNIRKDPEDIWKWVFLVITLIGLIPILGSALKGVFKIVFKFSKAGGKDAAKALESILAILRGAGKGDPVAFLRKLPYEKYTKEVLQRFDQFMNGFRKGIQSATEYMSSKWLKWALGDTAKKLRLVEAEMQRLQKLGHDKIPDAMKVLKTKVDELLGHAKPANMNATTDRANTLAHSSKPLMRLEYEIGVKRIGDRASHMRKAGKSEEEIAKWSHQERRNLGERFKNQTDPELRDVIYKRNTKFYGDPLGPSYDDLKRGYRIDNDGLRRNLGKTGSGKTDAQITQSATNAGGDDFPWDLILEFGREKKTGDPKKASELLKKIDEIVNGSKK
jgi:hypothetical protein